MRIYTGHKSGIPVSIDVDHFRNRPSLYTMQKGDIFYAELPKFHFINLPQHLKEADKKLYEFYVVNKEIAGLYSLSFSLDSFSKKL